MEKEAAMNLDLVLYSLIFCTIFTEGPVYVEARLSRHANTSTTSRHHEVLNLSKVTLPVLIQRSRPYRAISTDTLSHRKCSYAPAFPSS